jgi:hypothetical protein
MTGIILAAFYGLIFLFLIRKSNFFSLSGIPKQVPGGIFLLKIFFGFLYYFIYQYYTPYINTGDAIKYFNDSQVIFNSLFSKPIDFMRLMSGIGLEDAGLTHYFSDMSSWNRVFDNGIFNDSRTLIRFNVLVRFLSFGNFQVHVVIINILSFTGLTALYHFFSHYIKGKEIPLFITVFLIPSVLFWGSGISKEGLSMFSMGFFLLSLEKFRRQDTAKLKPIFLVLLTTCMMFLVKPFLLIILIPCIIALYWGHRDIKPRLEWKYLITFVAFYLVIFQFALIFPQLNLVHIIRDKQKDFFSFALSQGSEVPDYLRIRGPGVLSFIFASVLALFYSLLSPLIYVKCSLTAIPAAFENLLLLIFILLPVFRPDRSSNSRNFLYFALLFSVSLFILTGLTTPVSGAVDRYRINALPFLLSLIVMLTAFKKPDSSNINS